MCIRNFPWFCSTQRINVQIVRKRKFFNIQVSVASSKYEFKSVETNPISSWLCIFYEFLIWLSCHRYFRYLDENNLLDALPLEQWYGTCFAGVLTNQSLIRIWDKICGGSRKIVVFVFVTLFNWIWRTSRLSSTTQVPEIITIIDNVRFVFI